ncbi:MAG TPA: hypothetical protein VGK90_00585 [Rhizomicrobium sp.]|jgi:hypothetical protein
MRKCTKILITGTALAILPLTQACADGSNDSYILNGQIDLQSDVSKVNAQVLNTDGSVAITSIAGGNNAEIVTMNNTYATNKQFVGAGADIVSILNANVQNTTGSVSLDSEAACNQVSVSTDPHEVNIKSEQVCDATDPYAELNANVQNTSGGVSLNAQATGNSFEEDTNAPFSIVRNYQTNNSAEYSNINTSIANTTGNVTATSIAIGNNAQIVHY